MHYTKSIPLNQLRKSRGLTLQEVARKLRVSTGYISHVETGRLHLTESLAHKLAALYGVSVRSLLQNSLESKGLRQTWIGAVRINGSPIFDAFAYHLMAKPDVRKRAISNHDQLANEFLAFINEQFFTAFIAEFDSHKNTLLPLLLERVK